MDIDARCQLPSYSGNHGLCFSLVCAGGTEPSSSMILWSQLRSQSKEETGEIRHSIQVEFY